ncbi:Hypothetical protein SRAE_X000024500 [Strongyloides ratti]|uniref:Uncharacterized protein n=1 Tax=Strongyloides ratti TaxID=34506 RepID=A0A090LM42_STRRB|nr:Hypothetical protein SRAE_X000024500 [Strongyloides ratti]CEF70915.1 Hypothetical protein SRAE_X000024500 [Strongyloides ratti]
MRSIIVFQLIFFLIYTITDTYGSKRIKRQILPNDKIKVYSVFSNITFDNNVVVDSTQSRINVTENIGNLVVFSESSKLEFPSNCQSFNLTLKNQGTFFNISNIKFAAISNLGHLSESSNRISNSDETTVYGIFNDNVNLKVDDGQTLFQAINGTSGSLNILTRQQPLRSGQETDISVLSLKANHSLTNNDKTLYIESETTTYEIMASITGADIGITFNGLSVLLYNNYNRLSIYTNSYVYDINAEFSNYSMRLSNELFVVYTSGNVVTIIYDLRNHVIKLIIQQPSDTGITLGGATIEGNNNMSSRIFGDVLHVKSSALQITLNDNENKFLINTNKSQLQFGCKNNSITLVSSLHEFQIIDGSPNITVQLNIPNFFINIFPRVNISQPLWLSKDNFNESQFGNLSNVLDSIITNISYSDQFNNETNSNIFVDNNGNIINTGHVTNQNILSTNPYSNEVTLIPNIETLSTASNPISLVSSTFITPNLISSTDRSTFNTLVPNTNKNNQITTWQSTFNKEGLFEDLAVFQYNTEPSRNGIITITATVSSIDLNDNDINNYLSTQQTISMENVNTKEQNDNKSSTSTLLMTENMTTTPINNQTELNNFPSPPPLIKSRFYNLFRKTRNIMKDQNTYYAILKKKN